MQDRRKLVRAQEEKVCDDGNSAGDRSRQTGVHFTNLRFRRKRFSTIFSPEKMYVISSKTYTYADNNLSHNNGPKS
jgi:hypothetical protein